MKYGDIIKRAWTITWRYKALWVLGIFAGVSGCQGGGSSGGSGGGNSGFDQPGGSTPDFLTQDFERFIGIAVAVGIALVAIGIIWFIVSLAAEAGLVHAVNEIERRNEPRLSDAWHVGWRNWGRVFGIRFLLGLPALAIIIAFLVALFAAAIPAARSGNFDAGPEAFGGVIVSLCGAFLCGVPLLVIIISFADLLALTGIRYAVLGNRGVIDSIGSAWKALRARLKDHVITYLIGGALNAAASFVIAIPIIILAIALLVPTILAADGNEPGTAFIGALVAFVIVTIVLSILFNGIWGTFSSAYWTLFFRSMTGMDVAELGELPVRPAPVAPAGYGAPYPPQGPAPYGSQPGSVPPAPPAPPVGDPFAPPPPAPPAGAAPHVPPPPVGYSIVGPGGVAAPAQPEAPMQPEAPTPPEAPASPDWVSPTDSEPEVPPRDDSQ